HLQRRRARGRVLLFCVYSGSWHLRNLLRNHGRLDHARAVPLHILPFRTLGAYPGIKQGDRAKPWVISTSIRATAKAKPPARWGWPFALWARGCAWPSFSLIKATTAK